MAMPALKHDPNEAVARRPRLQIVKPGTRNLSAHKAPRQTASRAHTAAKEVFVLFAVVVGVVALLGVGRVWLSVQAAQASIDASELRREIKQERYRGDMLEIQQSALATPSRIQAIAGTTMGMAPATTVSYLDIRGDSPATAPVDADVAASQRRSDDLLVRVMDAAADEAQVLLVGDVGLVSSQ